MVNLYLDSFIFACPDIETEDLEEFDIYIQNLISWQNLLDSEWLSVVTSDKTIDILFETNSYPLWDDLRRAITYLGIENIQVKDIVNLVDGLLRRLPTIETKLGIRALLIDNFTCAPSYHFAKREILFVEHFQFFTMMMSLRCHLDNIKDKEQILITRLLKEPNINICGEVIDCEFVENSVELNLPLVLSGNFPLCTNQDELRLLINPVLVWKDANSKDIFNEVIDILIYQKTCELGMLKSKDHLLEWGFGAQFLETARICGFVTEEKKVRMLFRAIVETIFQENLDATHWLRNGAGPNDPQRKRSFDNAGAWRRDIDRDYHLHYWQISNRVEFASIAYPHDDMTIPE